VLVAATDRVLAWVTLETSRESRHWLPWRPNYDVGESSIEDCEDPERVVVFDDLSGALFTVKPIQDRFYLLCRFLDFINKCLPSSGLVQPNACFTEELNTDFSLCWKVGEAFPDADSLSAFHEVNLVQSELDRLSTFVENVYTQTIGLFEGDLQTALTLQYMHFKTSTLLLQNNSADRRKRKHAEKEVRQFFKKLLKQEHNRGNLAVWERYARFEWEIGNYDDSRKVFETSLAMAGSAVNTTTVNSEFPVIRLYSTYSHLELGVETPNTLGVCSDIRKTVSDIDQNMQTSRTLRILAMAVNGYQADSIGVDISPAQIVRARHFYQRRLDDMQATFVAVVSSDTKQVKCHGRSLLDWTSCFALFQFLTVGLQSASSVLQNFQTTLRKLSEMSTTVVDIDSDTEKTSNSSASENSNTSVYRALLQTAARQHVQLAQFHLSRSAAPLNVVRTALFDALTEFPDDVWFLKNFVSVEILSHISGRLREYFHRAVKQANTPLPVLYAILAERRRLLRLSTAGQQPCKS